MATVNGPVQNRGQIRWWYSVDGYSATADFVTVKVDAYFYQHSWTQEYNGSKSWSGTWGSGSAGQAYFLTAGQQVKIVTTSGVRVPLTGSARTIQFSVSTSHFYGATSHTLRVPVPARYAATPTNLKVTRNSDVSHLLQWSRQSTYSSVVVHRSTNGGAWTQVARPSGNAANWTDTTTKAGNKYDYRVAGVGGGGQSGWSNTATVYTSPNTPTGLSAAREGNNIVVNASGKPAYAAGYNIRDGATQVASSVQLPWTHVNPAPANTHTYTVQAVRGSLASGWSSASNTVQLLAAPQAPTNLAPNGSVVSSEGQTRLAWRHNPTDSSPQTAAEYRRRVKGTSSWTTGTVTTASSVALTLESGELEWQVRTKGQHPDWSPWSAVAAFTVIDKPGVAVTDPGDLWTQRTVTVKWSFDQTQGRPQSAWEASLLLGGEVVEHRTGSGSGRSVAFTTPLVDTQEYEAIVRAAAGDVWSDAGAQSFLVQVPPAAPADLDGVWSEESGAVTVEAQDGRGADFDPVTNLFQNSMLQGNGTWVELRRNFLPRPLLSLATTGWTAYQNATFGAATDLGRIVQTLTAPQNGALLFPVASQAAPTVEGDVWSARATVTNRSAFAVRLRVYVYFYGSGTNGFGDVVTIPPGETVELTAENRVATAGSTSARWSLGVYGDLPVNARLEVHDEKTLEKVAVLSPGFFDGDSAGSAIKPGMRSRWTGTANNSEAVLEGERVRGSSSGGGSQPIVGMVNERPACIVSADRATTVATAYYLAGASGSMPILGMKPGGTYRVRGTVTLEEPQVGPFDPSARRIAIGVDTPAGGRNYLFARSDPAPNEPGSYELAVDFTLPTDATECFVRMMNGSNITHISWSDIGVFEGVTYSGPVFNGSSGLVHVEGSWLAASWDGEVGRSTSTIRMAPPAVRADVERSVNGGLTWVPFITDASLPIVETDTEGLSNGVTMYRVTTYSADDASSVVVHEVVSDSPAAWLSGGDGYTQAARLPYDPEVSITRGRERAVRRYAGRSKPVVHAGEATTRTVDYGGTLVLDEQSPDELADLVADEAPVHLYRDPDGRHVYGAISDVQLTRESHAHWGFAFQLTETEN